MKETSTNNETVSHGHGLKAYRNRQYRGDDVRKMHYGFNPTSHFALTRQVRRGNIVVKQEADGRGGQMLAFYRIAKRNKRTKSRKLIPM